MIGRELLASSDDLALVERLRAGDEAAFMMLVEKQQPAKLRIARMYASSQAVAEEVVQDTWLGTLQGLAADQPEPAVDASRFRGPGACPASARATAAW